MRINKETLKALKPCVNRWKNYLEHYDSFDSTIKDFLSLDKITNDDKLFVIKSLVSKETLIKWSALCAESVLHLYENKHSNDKRVRDCIEYLLLGNYSDRDILVRHRRAVEAAASAADDYSASYAASAAEAVATYADAYSYAAVYSAAYAAAASHAADAASAHAHAREDQWVKNYNILTSLIS